ncbi:Blue copper oxidase CueO [Seminavis robusta]|uniref:Blue copper oxidase CueO n=1 Tax=Seminavis robusta TaxID=568900 RepID=A0A9N8DKX2_9STRA|nr:Blue copper oxidase CueO [Seminavis robusta]|eukprot:Sro179_g078340.1 Blue copper oxidase CueO (663) ;mRNA; r:7591-9675
MKLSVLFSSALAILPSVLAADGNLVEVWLEAKVADVEVGNGGPTLMAAKTFNGTIPGPPIEANVGDTLRVHFTNNLDYGTTLHWHGVEVPSLMDGTPLSQDLVEPGEKFVYEFDLLHASTHWYHTHVHTYEDTASGLYGALLIRDPELDAELPQEDHTLILDDLLLNEAQTGLVPFLGDPAITPLVRAEQLLNGRYGNLLVVNNNLTPVQQSTGVPMRLRLINAANTRFMRISFTGAQKVWKIAGDGGLFETPVEILPIDTITDGQGMEVSNPDPSLGLLLTPGERAEVVLAPTESINMEWHDLPVGFHDVYEGLDADTNETVIKANHEDPIDGKRPKQVLMEFVVDAAAAETTYEPPSGLVTIDPVVPSNTEPLDVVFGHGGADLVGDVPFYGQVDGDGNKLAFADITPEIAHKVMVGEERFIDVANADGYDHNYHLHGFFFQPVSTTWIFKNGTTAMQQEAPFVEWKDTIHLPRRPEAGGKAVQRLAVHFGRAHSKYEEDICAMGKEFDSSVPMSGGWLMHCHMLEHADFGMQTYLQVDGCHDDGNHTHDGEDLGEEEGGPTCAVVDVNDDDYCQKYIDRLPVNDNTTCDCYNFCNGELDGCYAFGEEQEDSGCEDFPRKGCNASQGEPGTATSAATSLWKVAFGAQAVLLVLMAFNALF